MTASFHVITLWPCLQVTIAIWQDEEKERDCFPFRNVKSPSKCSRNHTFEVKLLTQHWHKIIEDFDLRQLAWTLNWCEIVVLKEHARYHSCLTLPKAFPSDYSHYPLHNNLKSMHINQKHPTTSLGHSKNTLLLPGIKCIPCTYFG